MVLLFFCCGTAVHAQTQATEVHALFARDALALDRLNKTAEAIPYAEKSVQLRPDRSSNHYMLGKLYSKARRNADAIRELEASVRLDPQVEYPYYLLARTYHQIGDQAKAREWKDKLRAMKDAKDRAAGLGPPASESPKIVAPVKPWEVPPQAQQQGGASRP